jgi:hypothetical protein
VSSTSFRIRLTGPLIGALAVLAVFVFAGLAVAAPSLYDGAMTFKQIQGPSDPEEFSWEVQLGEDQELRSIDDLHAGVFYRDEERFAFGITATAAHDAEGSSVPTTLAVSAGNIVTLTVHHLAGNPAKGGASFVYPITGGVGWEGGFQTYIVEMPAPEPMPAPPLDPASCVVPKLTGMALKGARTKLRSAGCTLGRVWGRRSKTSKVVRQTPKPGYELEAGAEVGVKLGG